MANHRYSEQFKRDAVRLVIAEGYSVNKAGNGDEMPQRTTFASERDELEHLRAENRRLRMERDILKKATAFFAKDQTS